MLIADLSDSTMLPGLPRPIQQALECLRTADSITLEQKADLQ